MLLTARQVEESTFTCEDRRGGWYAADEVDDLLDEVAATLRAHESGLLRAGLSDLERKES